MSRSRNIKPGFFKNEDLAECSPWARLCFAGLWTLADREGRLEDRPKRIKAELFAFDSIEVEPLLVELAARGFIRRYTAQGKACMVVVAFHKHQNPHHREADSDLPPPESPGLDAHATGPKPEAGPGLSTRERDLPGGSSRADSLFSDSLFSDSGATKAEALGSASLWGVPVRALVAQGNPESAVRSLLARLSKEHTETVVLEAWGRLNLSATADLKSALIGQLKAKAAKGAKRPTQDFADKDYGQGEVADAART